MDVIALSQYGVPGAVGTLGTAATPEHVEALFRTTPDIVFCFDGDSAGRRAAWRALENTLPKLLEGRQSKFAFLPEGADPDSLVRERGPEGFEEIVTNAPTLGTYLFDELRAQVDLSTLDGRARYRALAEPLLSRIPEGNFRDLANQELDQITGLNSRDSSTLSEGTASAGGRLDRGDSSGSRSRMSPNARPRRTLTAQVIRALVQHPSLAARAPNYDEMRQDEAPGAELLSELLDVARDRPDLRTGNLLELFRAHPHHERLVALAVETLEVEEELETWFTDAVDKLAKEARNKQREARLQLLSQKSFSSLTTAEKDELLRLSKGE